MCLLAGSILQVALQEKKKNVHRAFLCKVNKATKCIFHPFPILPHCSELYT